MDLEQLDQLAEQLKMDKNPGVSPRDQPDSGGIQGTMREGRVRQPMSAESAFRKSVEEQTSCQKAQNQKAQTA